MNTVPTTQPAATAILYYDAGCPFCSACARFVKRFDKHHRINLSPLQGSEHETSNGCYETILFVRGSHQSQFSTAVVDVLKLLGGVWWFLGAAVGIIPIRLRDSLYRFVGERRYWFTGGQKNC